MLVPRRFTVAYTALCVGVFIVAIGPLLFFGRIDFPDRSYLQIRK